MNENMQPSVPTYVDLKSRLKRTRLRVQFYNELLSSDGGVALFNEIEDRSKIIEMACKFIDDARV